MTNLQADITAVMNQDSGAPVPTTDFISLASQIAAAVVGRSEIANSTTTSAGVAGAPTNITLNNWALFPMIHVSSPENTKVTGHGTDGGSASSPRLGFYDGVGGGTYDLDHRWILTA